MGIGNQKTTGGEIAFIIYRDIGEGHFMNRICKQEGTDVSPTKGKC